MEVILTHQFLIRVESVQIILLWIMFRQLSSGPKVFSNIVSSSEHNR